jgi:D-alanyl-D-alanine carboxypeptidase
LSVFRKKRKGSIAARNVRFGIAVGLLCGLVLGSSADVALQSYAEHTLGVMGITGVQAAENANTLGIGVSAEGYCVMNADTGEIVLQNNADEQFHPASITKIMTLLVTVENCETLDLVTTVSENALNQIAPLSSTLHPMPKPGEQLTIRDLLYGLTMCSGNECANILAEAVSGDIDSFVELMNERAKEAGATNTHFSNPHGLDAEDHLTTAHDMALIMKAALENPVAREILSAKTYTISATEYASERAMASGHKMVSGEFACEGVYAGKPGYTRLAQSTLVTAAERGNVNLIAVVMKSDSGVSYEDTSLLLDNAYAKLNNWGLTGGFNVYHPRVTEIDDTGFTVTWDVGSDAVRAEFPVWIEYDSTDTLTKDTAEVTGDTISYRVNLSDHAGKTGVYTVQAYVYNAAGESKVCSLKVLAGVGDQKGFVNWNGATYYVHENGALGLQWQELAEGCYYFDYMTGQMYTGWLDGDTKFYLDPDGKMHTGWLTLDGKQYYFYQAGDMVTGKMTIGNGSYYFDENGVLQSGHALPQAPSLHE